MNSKIKKALEYFLPSKVFYYLKSKKSSMSIILNLLKGFKYDFERYYKYSDTNGSDTASKLIGKIIREYHVIEKGLTMPQTRLGFGSELVLSLSASCEKYILNYGSDDEQLIQAIGVLLEYRQFHFTRNYQLNDDIISALTNLDGYSIGVKNTSQIEMTKNEYFNHSESSFNQFSNSRSSIRNFNNEEIYMQKILDVLELARNTPSACNRQSWRTYIYTDKEQIVKILDIQGGNRGFGHLTNKLIIITGELGCFNGQGERNQVFIDGGMYSMNLLYSLHYNHIAACVLNCSNTIEKDMHLRLLCNIKNNEVFISMVACGIPPEIFKVATSLRYHIEKTNTIDN